jgi:type IV secretory pathway VirJ component
MRTLKIYNITFLFLFLSSSANLYSQSADEQLPVTILPGSDTTKPLILYISGDGGWNKFSTSFINTMNSKGYPVVALNAKEYFWHKKDAGQTAKDVTSLLAVHMKSMKAKSLVLIGYSFGADVMPFVVTRCNKDIHDKLKYVVLMSPSETTDFEVHVTDLLGIGKSNGESIPAEINKITQPLLFVFGDKEDDFPFKQITIKNYKVNKLPGGHHYDGDPGAVCNIILPYIK